MLRGVADKKWRALKIHGNFCTTMQHENAVKVTRRDVYVIDFIVLYLAGAPGFEPGNGGIKIRCLTTWLRPKERRTILAEAWQINRQTRRV